MVVYHRQVFDLKWQALDPFLREGLRCQGENGIDALADQPHKLAP